MSGELVTRFVRCLRCGRPCRVADAANPEARLLRHALDGRGLCANCAASHFLQTTEPLMTLLAHDRSGLLRPDMQAQFAAMMRSGHADAGPEELDWAMIVALWELPFPTVRRSRHAV